VTPKTEFIDYYEVLQISPNAEPETIQRVYRMLAARYHPDNPHTGDTVKFIRLNEAYERLADPAARAEYDLEYQSRRAEPLDVFDLAEFAAGIDGEANRRMGILCLLYSRRRTRPEKAGMSILEFETLMSMPREHLMFSLWYLKEKHLIRQDESSDFVITAEGVDQIEANLPSHRTLYNLLKSAEEGTTRAGRAADAAVEREQRV
jgi:curved DNA-binding protein CbpA